MRSFVTRQTDCAVEVAVGQIATDEYGSVVGEGLLVVRETDRDVAARQDEHEVGDGAAIGGQLEEIELVRHHEQFVRVVTQPETGVCDVELFHDNGVELGPVGNPRAPAS